MVGDSAPKRFRLAVDFLAFLTFLALVLSGWALYGRFAATNEARRNNQHVWHAVICSIEQATLSNTKRPLADRKASVQFFERLLINNVKTAPCRLPVPRR